MELRLRQTKQHLTGDGHVERDDIDGLSVPTNSEAQSDSSQATSNTSLLCDKLSRDNVLLKQQLEQLKANEMLMKSNERDFFELKLKEKDRELLELEKQAALNKRKHQKLGEDMQDMQRMCEGVKLRNRDLEKTQLKFDADMSALRGKLDAEKELREKCEREREAFKFELLAAQRQLEAQRDEAAYSAQKSERLERDLKEYEAANGTGGQYGAASNTDQFMKMKSQIRDMENKIKDQEEELDDQQGLIQAKLRLEMHAEKEKQKWLREIAEKESEMDDLRFHTQKKIKAIEMQLEEESEISGSLQREKRELERKLKEMNTGGVASGKKGNYLLGLNSNNSELMMMNNGASVAEYLAKLKRQMLKYKMLAIDAQTQLEKIGENVPKQSIMKALKSQLEDSEISRANALKSKQILQVEINDLQMQLEEVNLIKQNVSKSFYFICFYFWK